MVEEGRLKPHAHPLIVEEEAVVVLGPLQEGVGRVRPVIGGKGSKVFRESVLRLDVDGVDEHVGRLELPILARSPSDLEGKTDIGMELRRGIPTENDPRQGKFNSLVGEYISEKIHALCSPCGIRNIALRPTFISWTAAKGWSLAESRLTPPPAIQPLSSWRK